MKDIQLTELEKNKLRFAEDQIQSLSNYIQNAKNLTMSKNEEALHYEVVKDNTYCINRLMDKYRSVR